MARAGWAEPLWLGTTVDDPGAGMCAEAAEEKADLVIVCGGDGTVRVCAQALAGTDTPLALLPSGTGNLLARNLGIPLDDEDGGAAHRHVRSRPAHRRRGGRGPQVRGDGRPGLRRGDHARRVRGPQAHDRLAGVRRVRRPAPARSRDPGPHHARRRQAVQPAGADRGGGQRRQAAGRDPAAARCRAGRRGARRGAHRSRQHRRLGPRGGPGDDAPRTGGPPGRAVPRPARAARDRPSDAAPARR